MNKFSNKHNQSKNLLQPFSEYQAKFLAKKNIKNYL